MFLLFGEASGRTLSPVGVLSGGLLPGFFCVGAGFLFCPVLEEEVFFLLSVILPDAVFFLSAAAFFLPETGFFLSVGFFCEAVLRG